MTDEQSPDDKPTFESALTQLESIVTELETGDLGLDASVERFREATLLAGYCRDLIKNAWLRITELQPERQDNGAGDDVPF